MQKGRRGEAAGWDPEADCQQEAGPKVVELATAWEPAVNLKRFGLQPWISFLAGATSLAPSYKTIQLKLQTDAVYLGPIGHSPPLWFVARCSHPVGAEQG